MSQGNPLGAAIAGRLDLTNKGATIDSAGLTASGTITISGGTGGYYIGGGVVWADNEGGYLPLATGPVWVEAGPGWVISVPQTTSEPEWSLALWDVDLKAMRAA